ncbi:hypothetical protein M2139_001361 [Enterococcus sp. PF1-24]|uniref:DUF5301 domain-containing protein n=1 Tax=unclassified Enterococcus TaxID=2608891 RepID=UPI002473E8E4|nr:MULTISPECIES: DUF5301 domain-containing protein [unclassified Enterococcus]MDH6364334.1 hypothetical protein [Enterococcus sp. PFB1-1]MDH6401477.1 hypothetical protein [Enterococcus sp. PF1-24]
MKHKKLFISLLFIALAAIIFLNWPKEKIQLAENESVKEIMIVAPFAASETVITEASDIKKVLQPLRNATKTRRSINNDQPLTQNYYTIKLAKADDTSDIFYLYAEDDYYFLEIPYQGIYKLANEFENFNYEN